MAIAKWSRVLFRARQHRNVQSLEDVALGEVFRA